MARRQFSRGQRRLTSWEEGVGGTTATAISAASVGFLGSVANPTEDGLTMIRVRGLLNVSVQSASAAADGMLGAFGIGIFPTEATAVAGATSVKTPLTDMQWDGWLWHQFFSEIRETSAGNQHGRHYVIDSKAMRKLRLGDSIALVFEVIEIGTTIIQVTADSRILLKLP